MPTQDSAFIVEMVAMSTKLERLIRLDDLIRKWHYPHARTLAQLFEVAERTAYEDLEFLRDRLNAPVEYDEQHGGWYYTEPNWALPAFITTEGEFLTFLLSTQLVGNYLGSDYKATIQKAIDSLANVLPNKLQVDLNALVQHYSFVAGATTATQPRLLSDLTVAIRDRHPVEVEYYTASRDMTRERVLFPYGLRNVRGDWHLVAFDDFREEVRVFSLTRIQRWRIQYGVTFPNPDDFSLEDYMAQAFLSERGGTPVEVVIQFDAYQARYIRERRWHLTQQPLEDLPDGGIILRFTTGAMEEVQRWVLQFGSHAVVLAPTDLRRSIVEEITVLSQKYS
jgi:predicted DNA-binding transcriptional regulator YafY